MPLLGLMGSAYSKCWVHGSTGSTVGVPIFAGAALITTEVAPFDPSVGIEFSCAAGKSQVLRSYYQYVKTVEPLLTSVSFRPPSLPVPEPPPATLEAEEIRIRQRAEQKDKELASDG